MSNRPGRPLLLVRCPLQLTTYHGQRTAGVQHATIQFYRSRVVTIFFDGTSGGPCDRADPANREFGDVEIFPADNPWNTPIDALPVHPNSANFVASIGIDKPLHPDFGTQWKGQPSGIQFDVVPGDQKRVPITFRYKEESDAGPYPIPDDAKIEGGPPSDGDRHVIVVDPVNKRLYEVFRAFKRRTVGKGAPAPCGISRRTSSAPKAGLGRRRRPADLPGARAL